MLQYINTRNGYEILVSTPLLAEDVVQLENLFSDERLFYKLVFQNIYNIPASMVAFLYTSMYVKKFNMEVVVDKSRLSKYLSALGINVTFVSRLKALVCNDANIDTIIIGGSANSSEKIIEILSAVNTKNFTLFIIQHIDPKKDAYFDTILSEHVDVPVMYAKNNMDVKKGNIYIAPQDKHLLVENAKIILDDSKLHNSARPSISVSFNSLSREYKNNLLAILTCGYAYDGVDVLASLQQNKSTIIVQEPQSCKADSIPLAAQHQGIYDYVLESKDTVLYIKCLELKYLSFDACIDFFLHEIFKKYDYDFRLYQRDTVQRRIKVFMIKHRIKDIKSFIILVLFHKVAFHSFFLDLSINVTEFFRKVQSSQKMIHIINKYHKNSYNIKLWSAGCSSGEEVYSTAIILSEMGLLHKSTIYATDFNPVVIEEAKNGIYPIGRFEKASQAYKKLGFELPFESFFAINANYMTINKNIRDKVLFFVHNLAKDSVFNEFDIIECKNVMIYFDEALKLKIFQMFYDSLKFGGHLFLGESEELPKLFNHKFEQCKNKECKIYMKVT